MAGTWRTLTNLAPAQVATTLLLTDGTVLAQGLSTNKWYRLTPDASGDYGNGTWATMADSVHAPLFYASGVLRDGRVIVVGGEYDGGAKVWLLGAEMYDPWPTPGRPCRPRRGGPRSATPRAVSSPTGASWSARWAPARRRYTTRWPTPGRRRRTRSTRSARRAGRCSPTARSTPSTPRTRRTPRSTSSPPTRGSPPGRRRGCSSTASRRSAPRRCCPTAGCS